MKVLLKNGKIAYYRDSYGARLIEQGAAVPVQEPEEKDPDEPERQKPRKKKRGEKEDVPERED